MAAIEPLIDSREIKTDYIRRAADQEPTVVYDARLDTMTVLYVPRHTPTFIYYVDGNVGLVCHMDSLEVVGFQIEAFRKSFLPERANAELEKKHAPFRLPDLAY